MTFNAARTALAAMPTAATRRPICVSDGTCRVMLGRVLDQHHVEDRPRRRGVERQVMLEIIQKLLFKVAYPAIGKDDIGRQSHHTGPQMARDGGRGRMNDGRITLRREDINELADERFHCPTIAIAV